MKKLVLIVLLLTTGLFARSQTCQEYIEFVKANGIGTTYYSYDSDAISKVTFYDVTIDYQTYHFAIVCFKREYSYSCSEYIYQVSYSTQFNYSLSYHHSAGKAFWEYIRPYNKNLGCAPNFK